MENNPEVRRHGEDGGSLWRWRCAALFMNAARKAIGRHTQGILLRFHDHVSGMRAISAEARRTSFNRMMELL